MKKGGKQTEETKKKISESLKGKKRPPFSEEWKSNISKAHKGHTSWNKGKHPSLETREKMSRFWKGKRSNAWKGGEIINSDGYILIHQPNHPRAVKQYVKRSYLIMEKMIGRYLTPEEIVHHKGVNFPIKSAENKLDDSPENLQLFFSKSNHQKLHHPKGTKFHRLP